MCSFCDNADLFWIFAFYITISLAMMELKASAFYRTFNAMLVNETMYTCFVRDAWGCDSFSDEGTLSRE